MADDNYIELTMAEADALKQGIELGREHRQSIEEEVHLMMQAMGIETAEEAPQEAHYFKAMVKLLKVSDPGGALSDIDKRK